jgi:hypothetical protein
VSPIRAWCRRGLPALALSMAVPLAACALPRSAHAAEADDGTLQVVVFEVGTGAPQAGRDVYIDGEKVGRTDRRGQVEVDLAPGERELAVETADGSRATVGTVRITADFVSEMLVTVYPDGRAPTVLTEQPGAEMTKEVEEQEGPTGFIRGRVVSSEDGAPIPNARVFVRGSRSDATTDADGVFRIELEVGARDLSIIHDKYATQSLNNISVSEGQETAVDIELVPAGIAMEAFVIRAPRIEGGTSALLDERRTSSAVGDVLGAEQMARSGDSSAAAALSRVTGLTVVGGKFVYVRGLGERYSSVLLNGATLPSPEPTRRVVPLDMFPAGILESVVIQKTFSPDMPGEFGGGSIQLRTKNIPTEPVFSVSLSGGFNSITTFREGLDYDGAGLDAIGAGASGRGLPDEVRAASEVARLAPSDRFCQENCYTDEDLEQFGEVMPNNWNIDRRTLPPDFGMSMTVGTGSETALFGRPAGILYGTSFSNGWQRLDFRREFYVLGAEETLTLQNGYDFVQATNQVNWSHILALGASPADGHEIRATSLLLRRSGDETRIFQGENDELDTEIRSTRLRYLERMLIVQQLSGEHQIIEDGPSFHWRYSYARASQLEPDRRQYQYDYDENLDDYIISQRSGGNLRLFGELVDQNHDIGGWVDIPFG